MGVFSHIFLFMLFIKTRWRVPFVFPRIFRLSLFSSKLVGEYRLCVFSHVFRFVLFSKARWRVLFVFSCGFRFFFCV